MPHVGVHAIVVGASLAGLATAATLAERFERVTVVERDTLPAGRQPARASRRAATATSCFRLGCGSWPSCSLGSPMTCTPAAPTSST